MDKIESSLPSEKPKSFVEGVVHNLRYKLPRNIGILSRRHSCLKINKKVRENTLKLGQDYKIDAAFSWWPVSLKSSLSPVSSHLFVLSSLIFSSSAILRLTLEALIHEL